MTTLREEIQEKVSEIWDIGQKGQGINLTGYTSAVIEIFEKLIDEKWEALPNLNINYPLTEIWRIHGMQDAYKDLKEELTKK